MNKAGRLIRAEMKREGVGSKEMCKKLIKFGEKLEPESFNVKISRGNFKADFFLNCMEVLEIETLNLKLKLKEE